jgi:hypothetical protein
MNSVDIDNFIIKVKYLHEKYPSVKGNIKIDEIIYYLNELNELVEIYSVKNAILSQIEMLIVLIIKEDFTAFNKDMLHTVFYGNPGVGKSKTAFILAKIWRALGILKRSPVGIFLSKPKEHFDKISQVRIDFGNLYDGYLVPDKKDCKGMMEKYEKNWLSIYNQLIALGTFSSSQDENIIICGREDFVAEYAGQTSIKTSNFLKKCLGKCVIIEEAYLLYLGESDTYGLEAITVLNRFMDEYKDELIVIFTGYENKLKESIFKAQPGLERRCQWFFHLQGYTVNGLSRIFIKQLTDMDWDVKDSNFILNFIKDKISYFPNYGGDTQKFAFKCKLHHSKKIFNNLYNNIGELEYTIDDTTLVEAFEEYKKHITLN